MRRHLSRLNDEHRMRLSSEQIAEFEGLGNEEGIARMQAVAEWLSRVNVQNHDGVRITPVLSALLTQTEDVEGTIRHLGRSSAIQDAARAV